MAAKDELGRAGEERAARHLRDRGYEVLARNWRCRLGELDIVASRDGIVCIVEVKTRTGCGFGDPLAAVDERKRRRLWRLAYAWAEEHPDLARGRPIRLEVVGIVGADPERARIEHLVDLR